MVRQPVLRHRAFRWLVVLAAVAFLAVNAVAFRHAWAMTHFAAPGVRTEAPERLGVWAKFKVLVGGVSLPRPINERTPAALGLKFETVRFPTSAGLSLEAWKPPGASNSPVVLAFGGYGGSKEGLLPVAREFHGWGAEVWLVDFRGCGGSEGDVTSIGFHEADDVAAAVTAAMGQGSRPVVLYGTSMGAAAILHAVHRRQVQPAALVLECPFDRLLSTVENRFRLMGLPPFPLAHLLVFWGGAQQGFNGFAHNPVAYAASVSCPTLLLQGDRDTRVRLAEANAIAASLGSSGQQVVFAGLGHESYLVAQPDRWRTEVGGFLSRVVAAFSVERPRETPPRSE